MKVSEKIDKLVQAWIDTKEAKDKDNLLIMYWQERFILDTALEEIDKLKLALYAK